MIKKIKSWFGKKKPSDFVELRNHIKTRKRYGNSALAKINTLDIPDKGGSVITVIKQLISNNFFFINRINSFYKTINAVSRKVYSIDKKTDDRVNRLLEKFKIKTTRQIEVTISKELFAEKRALQKMQMHTDAKIRCNVDIIEKDAQLYSRLSAVEQELEKIKNLMKELENLDGEKK